MFRLLWSLAVVSLVAADTLYFEPGQSQRGQLRSRTVICPDQKSTCADGSTCCQLTTGQYGCCPLPKAVCCSDHQHCCPAGHKCDVAAAKCLDGSSGQARPWLQKRLAQPLTYVLCPGGQYQCPNSNTCCKSKSGDWGCCPFPKAACCLDGNHCCPSGYKCDLSHGTCVKSGAANVLLGSVQEAPKVDASSTRATGAGGQKLKMQTTQGANLKLKTKVVKSASGQRPPTSSPSLSSAKTTKQKTMTSAKAVPSQTAPQGKQAQVKKATKPLSVSKPPPPSGQKTGLPKVLKSTLASRSAGVKPPVKVPSHQAGSKTPPPARSQPPQIKKAAPVKVAQKTQVRASVQKTMTQASPVGQKKQQVPKPVVPSGQPKQILKTASAGGKTSSQQKSPTQQQSRTAPSKSNVKSPQDKKEKDKKAKPKERMIMDSIKETIQATMSAIKNTVHRVVGSGRKAEKSSKPPDGGGTKSKQDKSSKPLKQTPQAKTPKAKPVQQSGKKVDAAPPLKQKIPVKVAPKIPQKVPQKVSPKSQMKVPPKIVPKSPQKVPSKLSQKVPLKVVPKTPPKDPHKVVPKSHPKIPPKVVPKIPQKIPPKQSPKSQAKVPQKAPPKIVPKPSQTKTAGKIVFKSAQQKLPPKTPPKSIQQKATPKSSPPLQKTKPKVVPKLQQQKVPPKIVPRSVQQPKVTPPKVVPKSATQPKVIAQTGQQAARAKTVTKTSTAQTPIKTTKVPQRQVPTKATQQGLARKATVKVVQQQAKPQPGGKAKAPSKMQQQQQQKQQQAAIHQRASKPKLQAAQRTQDKSAAQKQQQAKLAMLKQRLMKQQAASSGGQAKQHLGVGRRLLGLAWRLIGLETVEADRPQGEDEASDSVQVHQSEMIDDVIDHQKAPDDFEPQQERSDIQREIERDVDSNKAFDTVEAHQKDAVQHEVLEEGDLLVEYTAIRQVNGLEEDDALEAAPEQKNDIKCPDGSSTCPDGTTCCKMQSGAYGCCPMPKAVCCSDHLHCCEEGQTCDIKKGSCNSGGKTTQWLRKIPASTTDHQGETAVVCPDQTTCPSGSTCCKLASSKYGCCPLPKAVCCSDHDHCCPEGYTCNVGTGSCTQTVSSVPWSSKQPAQPVGSTHGSNMCPDHKSMCPDGSTCCKMSSGSWGCCPMAHAVCCNDGQHCCPHGTTCDVGAGTCNVLTSSLSITNTRLRPVSKVTLDNLILKQAFGVIKCEDGTECPDGSTCCVMTSGKYACCQHSKAKCCEDKVHCCPKGYECPPKGSKGASCQKGTVSVSWAFFARSHARAPQRKPQAESVICPDSTVECPSGNTCCPMEDGGFGCCALPDAVCCKGGVCCPRTSECDSSGKRCLQTVPWVSKTPSRPREELTTLCSRSTDRCPVDSTCCKTDDGSWGCCGSPDAVCCSNGRSCCPKGTVCSEETGVCLPPNGSTSAQRAAAFLHRAVKGGHILY